MTDRPMIVLAVETATACQSVAVLEDERVLAFVEEVAEGSHARSLIPNIDRALKQAGLGLADLTGLALSIGPGSFTGLRVGVATMLGLRSVTNLPLVTVPTLEALAFRARGSPGAICPILKSRPGEVYWSLYEWADDGRLIQRQKERVGTVKELAEALETGTTVTGDGWMTYADEIRGLLSERRVALLEAGPEAMSLSAVAVGLRGMARLARGEVVGPIVTPLYVQRCEAEIKYDRSSTVSPVARRFRRVAAKRHRRSRAKTTSES
jgi:tRNA threonylcarbamoyladenosine biosynthesis protein TsaB